MNREETPLQRSWRRLGLTEVWGLPLLWFTIVVVAFLSLAFDAVRLGNYSIMWLPINALAFMCGVVVVLLSWLVNRFSAIPVKYTAIYNLVTASTAMGVKNMVTLFLCGVFGVDDSGSYLFRFLGGAGIGLALLLIYSNLVGARLEYKKLSEELLEKEKFLIGFRENISSIFAEEENELRAKTSAELLPRFQALQEQIEKDLEANKVAEQLKILLTDEVKPISDSLAKEAKSLTKSLPSLTYNVQPEAEVSINATDSIKPVASTITAFMSWWALATICLTKASFTDVLLASAIYGLLLVIFRQVTKAFDAFHGNTILLLSWLPGLLAALPAYFLFYQIPHTQIEGTLIPTLLVIGSWVTLVFGQAFVLEVGRERASTKLKEVLSKFERENTLFEQRLWVAQHVWYTLLHGTVQAALTAASIRAASKQRLSAEDRQLIIRDLQRATEALRNPRQEKVSLLDSLAALRATWEGILEITSDCPPQTVEEIQKTNESAIVVNEILKEAVSNAVRHAGATEVAVHCELKDTGNLLITVINNGSAPKTETRDGLGSRIFDTLCIERSLTWNSDKKVSEFQALIPLP